MDQGTDFSTTVFINSENNNVPQNVAGYIITSQLRKSLYSTNVSASLVCSILSANSGEILITLDAANTANIPFGTYFYDVKINDTFNAVTYRLIEGVIFVTPAISQ